MAPSYDETQRAGRGFSLDLPEPIVPAAQGDVLLPADAVDGVDVYVPEAVEFLPGDRVMVFFGTDGAWADLESRVAHIANLRFQIGKDIQVFYRLQRNGETYPSKQLPLRVAPLADQDPLMPAPLVDEADGNIVDLRTFAGDATVTQPAWPFFDVEEYVWLEVSGTSADGSSEVIRLVDRYVSGDDEDGFTVTLPRSFLEGLRDGSELRLETRVKLGFDPDPDVRFPVSVYTLLIEGVTPEPLPAPWVDEAVRDFIDPFAVPDGATARVAANPAITAGTRVTLFMHGITSGGTPVAHEAHESVVEGTHFPLSFIVPHEKIFVLGGSTADFGYAVDVPDGSRLSSELRRYRIVSTVPSLPPPEVPKAEGDRLDPDAIDEHEGVEVDVVYPDIAVGDVVTLTWRGTLTSEPYTDTLTVFADSASFFVPKVPHVTGNAGGEAGIDYTVRYPNGNSARSRPLVLRIGSESRPEIFVDFEDIPDRMVRPGYDLSLADGAVTLRAALGFSNIVGEGDRNAPYCQGQVVLISSLSTMVLDLAAPAPARHVAFGFTVMETGHVEILLYGDNDDLIHRRYEADAGGHWFEYEATVAVHRIVLRVTQLARLDNLRIR